MMMKHKFVKTIPDKIENGIIYISMEYKTAIHNCCCGCGEEVVTPFSPKDWRLTYDGHGVSLYPSIGNWSFKCRSHYWIKNSEIEWAPRWEEGDKLENTNLQTYTTNKLSLRYISELVSNLLRGK